MIKQIKLRIRKSNNPGILHDSREDVRQLGVACSELIDKVNELVDKVNELECIKASEKKALNNFRNFTGM